MKRSRDEPPPNSSSSFSSTSAASPPAKKPSTASPAAAAAGNTAAPASRSGGIAGHMSASSSASTAGMPKVQDALGYLDKVKCFARGTQLRLYDGDLVAVEDVRPGTQLMGDDSAPRIVGQLTAGRDRMFRIAPGPQSGLSAFTVNGAHILVLCCNQQPALSYDAQLQSHCVSFFQLAADNVMHRCLQRQPSQAAAMAALAAVQKQQSEPLLWEVSVDDFLQAPADVQAACCIFSSGPVTFVNPLQPRLQQLLASVIGAEASPAQLHWAAWYLGVAVTKSTSSIGSLPPMSRAASAGQPEPQHQQRIMQRMSQYAQLFNEAGELAISAISSVGCTARCIDGSSDEQTVSCPSIAGRLLHAYGLEKQSLPQAWLCDSLDVRHRLLAGIIDGVGQYDSESNSYRLTAQEPALLDDYRLLAASLGLRTGAVQPGVKIVSKETDELHVGYSLTVSSDAWSAAQHASVTAEQRAPAVSPSDPRSRCSSFCIVPAGLDDYFGFSVYGGCNLRFLLSDLCVSHNSRYSHSPQVYNQFLDIMKDFKSMTIDTEGVIRRVKGLFHGHRSLILGFNQFLPPGYKIEVDGAVKGPGAGGAQAGQKSGDGGSGAVKALGAPSASQLSSSGLIPSSGSSSGYPSDVKPPSASAVSPSPSSVPASSSLMQQQQAAQPSKPTVEFNHAVNYVAKIKHRFREQPHIYSEFLDILHDYQAKRTIEEVYHRVQKLFGNEPDLLNEFRYFLPENPSQQQSGGKQGGAGGGAGGAGAGAAGSGMRKSGVGGGVKSGSVKKATPTATAAIVPNDKDGGSKASRLVQSAQQRVQGKALPRQVVHSRKGDPAPPRPSTGSSKGGKEGKEKQPSSASSSAPAAVAVAKAPTITYPPNSEKELAMMDKLHSMLSRSQWSQFIKILNLFASEIVSRVEMVRMLDDLLVPSSGRADPLMQELLDRFKLAIGYDEWEEKQLVTAQLSNYYTFVASVDFTTCPQVTASYRQLPQGLATPYCIAARSRITLASHTALPIEAVRRDRPTSLLSYSAKQRSCVVRPTASPHLLHQGLKRCVELLLEDGRTLVCTPDHRVMTTRGELEVRQLNVASDRLLAAPEGPLCLEPADDWTLRFTLSTTATGSQSVQLRMAVPDESERVLAFARLLGYMHSDCSLSSSQPLKLRMRHSLDAGSLVADVALLLRCPPADVRVVQPHGQTGSVDVVVPRSLTRVMQQFAWSAGKQPQLPAVVLAADTPVVFSREFLAAAFARHGSAPTVCETFGHHRWTALSLRQSVTADRKDASAQLMTDELLPLLGRFGVKDSVTVRESEVRDSSDVCQLVLELPTDCTVAFAERIGFRYSWQKQQRLSIAAGWYRGQQARIEQQSRLAADIIAAQASLPAAQAIATAVSAMQEKEVVFDGIIPTVDQLHRCMATGEAAWQQPCGNLYKPIAQYLQDIGASSFFTPQAVAASVSSSLPVWHLGIVGVRDAGMQATYDLSVHGTHLFIANGVVVHNCSGRTELCEQVLNDSCISIPTGSEDFSFKATRKNVYEEQLFKVEDERFELDMIIENNAAVIRVLEPLVESVQNMSSEQARQLQLNENLDILHLRSISRIYGDNGYEMVELLKSCPALAAKVILERLHQKDDEWRRVRQEMKNVWRKISEHNYQRSLDHRSFYFKQEDKKRRSPKALVAELREVHHKVFDRGGEDDSERDDIFAGLRPGTEESIMLRQIRQGYVMQPLYSYCMRWLYEDDAVHRRIRQLLVKVGREVFKLGDKEVLRLELFLCGFVSSFFDVPVADEEWEEIERMETEVKEREEKGEGEAEGEDGVDVAEDDEEMEMEEATRQRRRRNNAASLVVPSAGAGADRGDGMDVESDAGSVAVAGAGGAAAKAAAAVVKKRKGKKQLRTRSRRPAKDEKADEEEEEEKEDEVEVDVEGGGGRAERAGKKLKDDEKDSADDADDQSSSSSSANKLQQRTSPPSSMPAASSSSPSDSPPASSSSALSIASITREIVAAHRGLHSGSIVKPFTVDASAFAVDDALHPCRRRSRPSHLFFCSNAYYVFFRLHQFLYDRLHTAKSLAFKARRVSSKKKVPSSGEERWLRFNALLDEFVRGEDGGKDRDRGESRFEDECRNLLGASSYVLFTLDKLVHQLIKQVIALLNSEISMQLLLLYAQEVRRGKEWMAEARTDREKEEASAGLCRQYHFQASLHLSSDNMVQVELFTDRRELGIGMVDGLQLADSSSTLGFKVQQWHDSGDADYRQWMARFVDADSSDGERALEQGRTVLLRRKLRGLRNRLDGVDAPAYCRHSLELKVCTKSYKLLFVEDTESSLVFKRRRGSRPADKELQHQLADARLERMQEWAAARFAELNPDWTEPDAGIFPMERQVEEGEGDGEGEGEVVEEVEEVEGVEGAEGGDNDGASEAVSASPSPAPISSAGNQGGAALFNAVAAAQHNAEQENSPSPVPSPTSPVQ